ncbi:hypothetical protein [Tuwongella immobilis]|uniref:Uncharacterized protein n=1 Tax=Tuwongella immobilis TaxID=692036 RepID=A0A6C2YTC6_9BACT|nr:hypothetical protein [Tuwongella immobilis]VIP04726.1 unnamed protein product [Tuwongella immobilis]VTS06811.1 unnamed protein product [Tuwongella immobilis]
MDAAWLTKQAWSTGFLVAGLELLVIALACFARLVIELFRRREVIVGVLFAGMLLMIGGGWVLGVLAGLPVGWRYTRQWGIRPWMVVWSLALIGGVGNILLGGMLLHMSVPDWKEWFGWVPPF